MCDLLAKKLFLDFEEFFSSHLHWLAGSIQENEAMIRFVWSAYAGGSVVLLMARAFVSIIQTTVGNTNISVPPLADLPSPKVTKHYEISSWSSPWRYNHCLAQNGKFNYGKKSKVNDRTIS